MRDAKWSVMLALGAGRERCNGSMPAVLFALIGLLAFVLTYAGNKPIYTPHIMPDPLNKPDVEIYGPNFKNLDTARDWAVGEAARRGPQATWIICKDLFWDESLGIPICKEKLE